MALGLIEVSWEMLKKGEINWQKVLPKIYEKPRWISQNKWNVVSQRLDKFTKNWYNVYEREGQLELLKVYKGTLGEALRNPKDLAISPGFQTFLESLQRYVSQSYFKVISGSTKDGIVKNISQHLDTQI